MKLKTGDEAPNFCLPDQSGKEQSLAACRGRWVLLYFYPRDSTPGCTREACGIRDAWAQFRKKKIQVFGVSTDSVASHTKFADKYQLPFSLLADTSKQLVQQYGAWGEKKFLGKKYMGIYRISFLIDPKGKIARIYDKVKPEEHAREVLADIQQLDS